MLFAFFGLWSTTLLAGAAAVSIPVIIHLLNRRRYKIVTWAAMRFLLNAQRQNTRKLRIEQLLLLLTRMALVALIVFAMAAVMPWAEQVWASIPFLANLTGRTTRFDQRVHHILVIDASLSMNLRDGDKTLFDRARRLAAQKIDDSQSGDGFSILLLKDNPTWLVGEASQDRAKVQRELDAARAGHGNAGVPSALTMVAAKLTEASQRFPAQVVYFFTDLQKATWQGAAPTSSEGEDTKRDPTAEIKQRARVVFVDVGVEASNLAVTDLSFAEPFVTTGAPVQVNATVQNFGSEPRQAVRVELLVGKARDDSRQAPLAMSIVGEETVPLVKPNDRQTVSFKKYRFPSPGTYAVQVRLEHDGDRLELDNVRTVVVTVKDTIPVILVNGKLSPDRFDRATEYLRLALNPFPPGSEPKWAPIRPRVLNPRQFADLSDDELQEVDCVYWCDVPQIGTADLRRLEAHVRRGGGLVVGMGDKAVENLDAYNRLLYRDGSGLLPAKLSRKVHAGPEQHFYFKAFDEEQSFLEWPLKAFKDDEDRTTLARARFYQYVQATPAPQGKIILKFQPEDAPPLPGKKGEEPARAEPPPVGDVALVEWNPPLGRGPALAPVRTRDGKRAAATARYRGKVVLFTSTFNMDWTNWPASPSFGEMVQELTRLAVSGRLREQSAVVGAVLEDFLPGGGSELDMTVNYPAGVELKPVKTRTQLVEDVNVFQFADTDFSGIYRVVVGGTGQEIPFAVNVPTATPDQRGSESDLARLSEDAVKKAFPQWNPQVVTDARSADISGGPTNLEAREEFQPIGPKLAWAALLAALALLFIEVVMAWRFGHYTTVEGVTAAPATNLVWPLAVAAVAVALFLVGAWVMVSAVWANDFLAFWPSWLLRDQLRGVLEQGVLGIPPPGPGESSRWQPDMAPWFFGLGSEGWVALGILLIGGALIVATYLAEGPAVNRFYKLFLSGLRLLLLVMMVYVLLPQFSLNFGREAWPDLVVLVDTSRSMGEPDAYQDTAVLEKSKKLSDLIRKQVEEGLPERLRQLQAELDAATRKRQADPADAGAREEVDYLAGKLRYWQKQQEIINSTKWRPTRLQLVQALLAQPDRDWLRVLHLTRQMKVHLYQLDVNGRAVKVTDADGTPGDVTDPTEPRQLERAKKMAAHLEADGKESRLGTALRQVIDHYRGSSLAGVIMFTDGVTTRDETIAQAGEYAAQKGVPLFLVGIGDDHEIRDLKLHDLQVEDTVFKGDRVIFECRLTGQGYTDLTVPVVLRVKDKNGKEKEVGREMVKVDPKGKSVKVRLKDTPNEVGRKTYIIEVEPPKVEGNEKPLPPGNLRLERAIEVVEDKEINVLFVEQQPRYEFRYVKFLLERENPNEKTKKKSIKLKTVLLDADDDVSKQDRTALDDFPATLDELNRFDVVIFGDCDPNHRKLGPQRLRNLANFVRGEDDKGRKLPKAGGGFLMIAGTSFAPHAFKDTPLADIMPVDPLTNKPPPEPELRKDRIRPELTPSGRLHPIFRFSPDEAENLQIWQRLAPMYWTSSGYRLRPLAEVLAVHPHEKMAGGPAPNQDPRLPLVVQQYVGTGRSMFFGFDETWRWRLREDESKFNQFWVQVMRYLSRGRSNRTDLRLDKQTPYRLGEPIKVTVRFPDGATGPDGVRITDKTEVKVVVEHRPQDAGKDAAAEAEVKTMTLAKVEGSWGTYEGTLNRTREGKYRMRLLSPDVRKTQPDGEPPSADALVELPPGELDRLRMNAQEMSGAADLTQGRFYTLATADQVLDDLPPGFRVSLSSPRPPLLIWNHVIVFTLVMLLLTAEWFLRKRKHLL